MLPYTAIKLIFLRPLFACFLKKRYPKKASITFSSPHFYSYRNISTVSSMFFYTPGNKDAFPLPDH
jgi:hypothetical protein